MVSKTKHFKTAVVCMVHNSYEYVCEFLLHHLNIYYHIYIVDHNSERDLRKVTIDRVTVVRSNHIAQFQSETINVAIEHFRVSTIYDLNRNERLQSVASPTLSN